jgi:hypothetical protein
LSGPGSPETVSALPSALAVPATVRVAADPRSKFLLVLVANVMLMSAGSTRVLWLVLVVVVVLALLDLRVRVAVTLVAVNSLLWVLSELPRVWHHGAAVAVGLLVYWLLRFGLSIALGTWFVATTRVSELTAAMNAMRLPRFLTIPLAVLFRFLPVVIDEAHGVVEAMSLRGYTGSYLWRHPVDGLEKLVVPVLTACARTADELSAAALIRGLGVSARPTVVDRPRFRVADAVLVALVAGLVAYRFWGVWS